MNKAVKILSILLAAQLIFVLGTHLSSQKADGLPSAALMDPDTLMSEEIIINGEGSETKLIKTEDGWQLPDYGNLPASSSKVAQLLETLQSTSVNWPLASSEAAAERFEVADSNAQKSLTFTRDGKPQATLYLGTSPSYRKVHARLSDNNDIFSIELAQHDVPAKAESWLEKNLLSVEGDVEAVATEAFSLSRVDGNWMMEGLPEGKAFDSQKAEDWTKLFNRILVNRLVEGKDQMQSVVIHNPVFTATVTTANGGTNYAFYQKEDKWYVKTFGDTPLFEIAKYQAQPVIDVTPNSFTVTEVEPPAEEAANLPL